jgi:glycosyltransferase involved in cell wall biosynthesis
MRLGILLPGFSRDEHDPAIPVQLNLIRELARCEDVRVLALRYPFQRVTYSVCGAAIHALGVGPVRGLRRLALWVDALLTLRRLHRQRPFDVLHAMWADETGLIAAWAGRWLGVPVVVSVAGGEPVWLADIGYGLQGSRFSRWTVRQALQGADRIITASRYTQTLIDNLPGAALMPSDRGKRVKIPLGVDADHFRPTESPPPDQRRLIHVGSLIGVKDQATLLRAMARLPEPITLEIIGKGPERARLEQQAQALGLTQRVNFTGLVSHWDLPAHYQAASLHVLTSRHEGQGMVTLEAAACGLPTVSTAVGLLPDDPALGLTVPVGDDAALAAAILSLLADTARMQALRQSARAAVTARYTIQHTAAQLRTLYHDLIAPGH